MYTQVQLLAVALRQPPDHRTNPFVGDHEPTSASEGSQPRARSADSITGNWSAVMKRLPPNFGGSGRMPSSKSRRILQVGSRKSSPTWRVVRRVAVIIVSSEHQ